MGLYNFCFSEPTSSKKCKKKTFKSNIFSGPRYAIGSGSKLTKLRNWGKNLVRMTGSANSVGAAWLLSLGNVYGTIFL